MLLNERLGIRYPIIQGAMANIANAQFAACVSNHGALGVIATGGMSVERAREEIRTCKQRTKQPFGVNVMLMHPDVQAMIDMICEEQVAVVTCGAGNPGKYVKQLKASHALVFPVVPSVAMAKRLERSGVRYSGRSGWWYCGWSWLYSGPGFRCNWNTDWDMSIGSG